MRPIFIIFILSATFLQGMANQNKFYVSSKNGVTLFVEGGWDSVTIQKTLDDDLNFILDHIDKPPDLNIFIIMGVYGVRTYWRRKPVPGIFISVAYDSLSNTDTLYSQSFDLSHLNWGDYHQKYRPEDYVYANDYCPARLASVARYIDGKVGIKISYHDVWDSVNYYNHLLSVVDYAIRHIEEIKKGQQRMCLPASEYDREISILTYDTAKLKAIPIRDWGFTIDPAKRAAKMNHRLLVCLSLGFLLIIFFTLRRRLFASHS